MAPTYKDLRKYFDTFSTGFFKLGKHGECLYYPWGFFGSGYIVNNYWLTRLQSRKLGRLTLGVLFLCAIPVGILKAYWVFAIAALVLQLVQYSNKKRITEGLVRSQERLGYLEVIRDQAIAAGLTVLVVSEVLWLLLYICVIILAYMMGVHWVFLTLGTIFFGYVSFIFALMISLNILGTKRLGT